MNKGEQQFNQWFDEYADGVKVFEEGDMKQAYLAGAESREKRIDELEDKLANADYQLEGRDLEIKDLEKENAELKADNDARKFSMAMSEKVEKQLREEIAELKEKKIKGCYFGKDELGNDFFAKCDCVDCQKRVIALLDLRKEYLNKINKESYLNDQLTKAKDHIKKLLDCLKQDTNDPQTNYYVCQYMDKAEQFLNSEVEK